MGGCASKPKDLNAENPDLVPAENPTTTTPEPTVSPVESESTPTPEEVTAEAPKAESAEKEEEAKPEESGVKEEVKGGLVVEASNKVEEGGEVLSPKESETKKTDKDQEPTTTTTTTAPAAAVESAVTQNKVEKVKPETETKPVEEKPKEQH